MNKQEFLIQLRKGLAGLPAEDIEERAVFYNEMIEDRMEEGTPESEAVEEIGPVEAVIAQILKDTPLTKLVQEKIKPKRVLKAWEVVLIVLGSPIWVSLLVAAVAVALALYVVLWSVILSLWAAGASIAACALGGVIVTIALLVQGKGLAGLALLGAGICCAGISIFWFLGCEAATKGILALTKKMTFGMKSIILGKERGE